MTFALFPTLELSTFMKRCEDLWNNPKGCPTPRKILVFGVLYQICAENSEFGFANTSPERSQSLTKVFLAKLDAALAEARLLIPPSREAVEAFLIAVSSGHPRPRCA